MTEKPKDCAIPEPTDSELQRQFILELELMQQTDPKVLEERIRQHSQTNYPKDAWMVVRALELARSLYGDKTRKYSDTPAILHAYRVTLAGDNTAAYKTVIKLLHDAVEDLEMKPEVIDEHFGTDARLIKEGILAFTRREGEEYATYLTRLKTTALFNPHLSHLVADKMSDMITNCFDPVALPTTIERKPNTTTGMLKFLNKIDSHAGILLGESNPRRKRLDNAIILSRRKLQNSEKRIAA